VIYSTDSFIKKVTRLQKPGNDMCAVFFVSLLKAMHYKRAMPDKPALRAIKDAY